MPESNHGRICIGVIMALSVLSQSATAFAAEEPNLKLEQRFHSTYKRFNSEPTPESEWEGVQRNSSSGSYQIQSGDTLWDISETLFADPQFWPKIWSLNSDEIFNPHEINPNKVLKFNAGSLSSPPSVLLTTKEDAQIEQEDATEKAADKPAEVEKKKSTSLDDILRNVEIPAPVGRKKNASAVPGSMPTWTNKQQAVEQDLKEVQFLPRATGVAPLVLTAYASDGPTVGEGTLVQTEFGGKTAATYQYVYVKMTGATPGQKFLVVKDKGNIQGTKGDVPGILTHIQGQVQIADAVNPSEGIYRALVTQTFLPLETGASLISGEVPTYTVEDSPTPVDAAASVVGGAFSEKRSLYGKDQILFLESSGGVTQGQYLFVYKSQPIRDPAALENTAPRKIGVVKVLRAGTHFATAVVVSAESEIRTGDFTSPTYR